MRRRLWAGSAMLIAAIGIAVAARTGGSRNPRPSADTSVSLGVDSLMRNAERHRKGPVRVEGVVSAAIPEEKTLTLIDNEEFERCGLGCPELILPVRWWGAMPAVRERVRIEGEIEESGGKLIFVARSVDRLGDEGER